MKIAIIHDWLVTFGGAEKTLEQILLCFPEADLFTVIDFLPDTDREFLKGRNIRTSFMQKFPFIKSYYRNFLPAMMLAVEQFDLSQYDIIISSCHAVSKGVLTGPDQLHICYCYSPIRYAWDLQFQYLKESGLASGFKSWVARLLLHKIRLWDLRTEKGVDHFISISNYISRRIKKVYRRESSVIYPPVDTSAFAISTHKKDYYFTSSRMVPYKKIPLIVEAFSGMPDKQLIVAGDGPDLSRCKKLATDNVAIIGWQDQQKLIRLMRESKAFIFAAEEDFGIAPIEAQACGTPVIGFGKGALLETIRNITEPQPTGILFHEQSIFSIQKAIRDFEYLGKEIDPALCRENSIRFSIERFREEFKEFVIEKWKDFENDKHSRANIQNNLKTYCQ